jgi:hypothetical protein
VAIEVGGSELRAACRRSVRQKGGDGHLVPVLTGGGVGSPELLVDSCITESQFPSSADDDGFDEGESRRTRRTGFCRG